MLYKPIMFSAIQPSGYLTLGNYIGSISKWSDLQNIYDCIFSIADLHAITVLQNINILKQSKLDTLAFYLASGVDPKKSIIFNQSEVHEHCQLNWILNCYTKFSELCRMTQFKKKSQLHVKNINVGLFSYPILMSSDILLYRSNKVLIGRDQLQHLELARNVARKFNMLYGNIFNIPESYIYCKNSAKIMGLLNPSVKMSKSDSNKNNVIFLLEKKNSILKKISQAVTDSENKIYFDNKNKPGISNLLNIYSSLTGKSILELENCLSGILYKEFKYLLAQIVVETLYDLQDKFYYFRNQKLYLQEILEDGANRARFKAKNIIYDIYGILGLN